MDQYVNPIWIISLYWEVGLQCKHKRKYKKPSVWDFTSSHRRLFNLKSFVCIFVAFSGTLPGCHSGLSSNSHGRSDKAAHFCRIAVYVLYFFNKVCAIRAAPETQSKNVHCFSCDKCAGICSSQAYASSKLGWKCHMVAQWIEKQPYYVFFVMVRPHLGQVMVIFPRPRGTLNVWRHPGQV